MMVPDAPLDPPPVPKAPRTDRKKNSISKLIHTPEERKAWGAKMKLARLEAKNRRSITDQAPKEGPPPDPRPVARSKAVYQFVKFAQDNKFLIEFKEPDNETGLRQGAFKANDFQKILDDSVCPERMWHVILKCRQIGISTYIDVARLLVKCLTVPGTRAAIISHEEKATIRLLRKVHLALDDLKARKVKINGKPVKTQFSSKFEVTFPDLNSYLYIGTAGKRAFSRGDSLTDVHCSEVAFWPNAGQIMTGIVGALVRSAEVFLESTANGMGGYFYDMVKKCEDGKGPALLHFFPWHQFPEYSMEPPADVVWQANELELAKLFNLTLGQIWWRRRKMSEYEHEDQFYQEFPMTIDEAFIVSGACYFDKESLRENQKLLKVPVLVGTIESVGQRAIPRVMKDGPFSIYTHPKLDRNYIIGADCSEGVDTGDPASAVCLDRENCSEAAWLSGLLDPLEMAKALFGMGQFYNWAWLGVEDNGPGLAVLTHLQELGYPRLYKRIDPNSEDKRPRLGFHTDARTRPLALGALRSMMKTRAWGVGSAQFHRQMTTFVRHNDGGYRASFGSHDDDVMAASIAAYLQQRLPADLPPAEQERESRLLGPSGQKITYGHKTGY